MYRCLGACVHHYKRNYFNNVRVRVDLLLKLKAQKEFVYMCSFVVCVNNSICIVVDVVVVVAEHTAVHFNVCAKIVNGNRINRVQWNQQQQ